MTHINLYSNKKAHILSWQKAFIDAGYHCKAIERLGENGRPGHSKFCLTIYYTTHGAITQDEYKAFEESVLKLYREIIG